VLGWNSKGFQSKPRALTKVILTKFLGTAGALVVGANALASLVSFLGTIEQIHRKLETGGSFFLMKGGQGYHVHLLHRHILAAVATQATRLLAGQDSWCQGTNQGQKYKQRCGGCFHHHRLKQESLEYYSTHVRFWW